MTKLVDVQGLKPCPAWGSGSSPDTGNIYYFFTFTLSKVLTQGLLASVPLYSTFVTTASIFFLNSWLIHCLFIFIFITAMLFRPLSSL
jgi:hypothetical protein